VQYHIAHSDSSSVTYKLLCYMVLAQISVAVWTAQRPVCWRGVIPRDMDLFTLMLLRCFVAQQKSTFVFRLCERFSFVNIENMYSSYYASRDSSVGIAMGYWLGGRGSNPGISRRFLSSSQRPAWLWGPLSLLSNGNRGVELLGRKAYYSPPSNADVKNGGSIPPLPRTS
jgi:hypothetical protein